MLSVLALMLATLVPQVDDRPQETARSVLDGGGYQLQLPTADGSADPPQAWHDPRPHRWSEEGRPGSSERSDDLGAPIAGAGLVGWVLLIVGVVAGLVWAAGALAGWQRDVSLRRDAPAPAPDQPTDTARAAVHGDAAALAAAGRYGEAIHVLLGRALLSLQDRSLLELRRGATGRELASRLAPEHGRDDLVDLVGFVEHDLFAATPAGPDAWEASLLRYRRLVGGDAS